MKSFIPVTFAALIFVVACGEESPLGSTDQYIKETDPNIDTYVMPVPLVQELTPTNLAAGDIITVFGEGFVPTRRGFTTIHLRGNFVTAAAVSHEVDFAAVAAYDNSGKVTFPFEPAAPPNGFGTEMGTFSGHVWAVNHDTNDEETKGQEVEPATYSFVMKPSVILNEFYPENVGCANTLTQSLEGTKLNLEIELIGFEKPTINDPITVEVVWIDMDSTGYPCPIENLDSPLCDDGREDIHRQTIVLNNDTTFSLSGIDFGMLPVDQLRAEGTISILAKNSETTSMRTLTITMHRDRYVDYDGSVELAEIFPPELVSGCIPGGEYGSNIGYGESQAESRSRSVAIKADAGVKIPGDILSVSFGISVTASVSTTESNALSLSRHIIANQYGVVYRQTQRLLRRGDIVEYNACGIKQVIGEALVTDWTWAPDIAITHNGVCPPAPPSNLPAAKVYIE